MKQLKRKWLDYLETTYKSNQSKPETILEKSKFNVLIKNSGRLSETNYVERFFQEVYYGSEKFMENYGFNAIYYTHKTGFYTKEKLVIPYFLLDNLKEKGIPMGIFTGRPKLDLELLFDHFCLDKYFLERNIITLTDILLQEKKYNTNIDLSKPNPWGLKELERRLPTSKDMIVIGDSLDDLLAAERAHMIPIYFNLENKNKLQANVKFQTISDWNELFDILKEFL